MKVLQIVRGLVNVAVFRGLTLVRRRGTVNRRVSRNGVVNSRRTYRACFHLRFLRRLRRLHLCQRVRYEDQLINSRRTQLGHRHSYRKNALALATKGLVQRPIRVYAQRLRRFRRVSRVITHFQREQMLFVRSRQFYRVLHSNRRQVR